ncbi:hypothetical protein Hanom_Chr02g00097291 [Helianthus anomalus]
MEVEFGGLRWLKSGRLLVRVKRLGFIGVNLGNDGCGSNRIIVKLVLLKMKN